MKAPQKSPKLNYQNVFTRNRSQFRCHRNHCNCYTNCRRNSCDCPPSRTDLACPGLDTPESCLESLRIHRMRHSRELNSVRVATLCPLVDYAFCPTQTKPGQRQWRVAVGLRPTQEQLQHSQHSCDWSCAWCVRVSSEI